MKRERGKTMVTKRKAVIAAFGNLPPDSQYVDFLYARRHLAKAPDPLPDVFEPAYLGELIELDEAITKTLREIRKRDGEKIFREAADNLIASIALQIESEPEDAI
jgi:hypothetical protein